MDQPEVSTYRATSRVDCENGRQQLVHHQIPNRGAEQACSTPAVTTDASGLQPEHQNNVGTTLQTKPDELPDYKDQARPAGFEAGENDAPSIPVARSVHIVINDPADPATLPALVVQTVPSGTNAENAQGSASPPTAKNAVNDGNNASNDVETPAVPTGAAASSQQTSLRKHLIWAGAFVLVAVMITLATILDRDRDGSSSDALPVEQSSTTIPGSEAQTDAPFSVTPSTTAPSQTPFIPPGTATPTKIIPPSTAEPTTLPPTTVVTPESLTSIQLTASDGTEGDKFGSSIAIDGDTIVVGAESDDTENGENTGSTYVFTLSGTVWTELVKLLASDGASNNSFGSSVAIEGDTIVIGADGGIGRAYVFTRTGNTWTEQAKLAASDGDVQDHFGNIVAKDGSTIIIGAWYDETETGASAGGSAYVYTHTGNLWTEEAKLTASDATGYDYFGRSVGIYRDTIVIGANGETSDNGNAYIYTHFATGWTEQAILTASDGAAGDDFGISVALDGDTIVIGAYNHDSDDNEDSGSVYVYTGTGSIWTEQAKLTASDGAEKDWFGSRLAIDGDTIVVGAYGDDAASCTNCGSAYVYTRFGSAWTEQAKLTASDGAMHDNFGRTMALDGGNIVIGAPSGSLGGKSGNVYIFY